MKTKKQTVFVVEIQLRDSIVAVGTSETVALKNCAARAYEYLKTRDALDPETGRHWTKRALVDYFGYRVTECELDGIGQRH